MVNGVSVCTILILLVCPLKSHESFTVKLKTISNPIVFGETVRLLCTVTGIDHCNETYTRTWTHGKNDDLIFYNGQLNHKIADKTKYVENVDSPCQSFSLLIRSFNESDAVDTYECSFTAETQKKGDRKTISLDGTTFIYIPTSDMIASGLIRACGGFAYIVIINKVSPQPVCTVKRKIKNQTSAQGEFQSIPFNQSDTSIFYGVMIRVFGITDNSFSVCDIIIICKIGNQDVNIGDIIEPRCGARNSWMKKNLELWPLWVTVIAYQLYQAIWDADARTCYANSRWKRISFLLVALVIPVAISASVSFMTWGQIPMLYAYEPSYTHDNSWTQHLLGLFVILTLFIWNNRKMWNCNLHDVLKHLARYSLIQIVLDTAVFYWTFSDALSPYVGVVILVLTFGSTGGSLMFSKEKKEEAKGRSEISNVEQDKESYELNSLVSTSNSLKDTNVSDDVNKVIMSGSYETEALKEQ